MEFKASLLCSEFPIAPYSAFYGIQSFITVFWKSVIAPNQYATLHITVWQASYYFFKNALLSLHSAIITYIFL
jgi:hypothetical protein